MFKQHMRRSLTRITGGLFPVMSLAGSALAETEHEVFRAAVEEIFATYSAANVNGNADLQLRNSEGRGPDSICRWQIPDRVQEAA